MTLAPEGSVYPQPRSHGHIPQGGTWWQGYYQVKILNKTENTYKLNTCNEALIKLEAVCLALCDPSMNEL